MNNLPMPATAFPTDMAEPNGEGDGILFALARRRPPRPVERLLREALLCMLTDATSPHICGRGYKHGWPSTCLACIAQDQMRPPFRHDKYRFTFASLCEASNVDPHRVARATMEKIRAGKRIHMVSFDSGLGSSLVHTRSCNGK